MDNTAFKDFIKLHRIIDRTYKHFWICFGNFKKENPEDFHEAFESGEKISLKLARVSLVMNYRFGGGEPIEHVQSTIDVYSEDIPVAEYHFLFTLDGLDMDDALSFF
ncbi:hypothetical protein YDYSY3_02730 [Paenibacillus chitinolyticus]|uniref:hypothetical protein n=1 Tax=Paenibacillus chitinolyticus TaxID=79263 RepID=UPI0026E4CAC7|nr:hypothetical protein [Paenibacillus chitinolyticus]GKS09273.1 hypothetical protein YDYSY3_02730 [Paenibacillus chitinolyticus]